jgi:hypothetical protein
LGYSTSGAREVLNVLPVPIPDSVDVDLLSRSDRRLIAAVLEADQLLLPTDCPDIATLVARLDAMAEAERSGR